MDDRRIFWLCIGWFGLMQAARWGFAVLRVGLWHGNTVALAATSLIVLVSLYALARPETVGGPTDRDLTFWAAVAAAVLGTVSVLL
jgi:hypothetical protein